MPGEERLDLGHLLEPGTVGVLGFPLTNTMRGEMEKIDEGAPFAPLAADAVDSSSPHRHVRVERCVEATSTFPGRKLSTAAISCS